jgi:hypothetical protein
MALSVERPAWAGNINTVAKLPPIVIARTAVKAALTDDINFAFTAAGIGFGTIEPRCGLEIDVAIMAYKSLKLK